VLEPGYQRWDKWLSSKIWDVELGEERLKVHEHEESQWFEVSRDVNKTLPMMMHIL
jgi:hypothetical protein